MPEPDDITPEMATKMEDFVAAGAQYRASLDLEQIATSALDDGTTPDHVELLLQDRYLAALQALDEQMVDPRVPEQMFQTSSRISDDFAVRLTRVYRDTYAQVMRRDMASFGPSDTAADRGIDATRDAAAVEAAHDAKWEQDLSAVRALRRFLPPPTIGDGRQGPPEPPQRPSDGPDNDLGK